MPELMTKHDAIEYLLYMKHDVQAKSPMDIALDTAIESLKQPTIEAEPVRHGRWIPQENCYRYEFKCSRCGHEVEFSLPEIVDPRDYICYLDDYCGGCGAKMDATGTNVDGKGGANNGTD